MERAKILLHPAFLMIGFWFFIYALYFLAPIVQTPPVSLMGAAFVGSMIFVFCIGSMLGGSGKRPVQASFTAATQLDLGLAKLINTLFLIGISGVLLGLYGKILSVENISFCSFSALRAARAQQLLGANTLSSSVLSGVGFFTYPAGIVAIVISFIRFETLSALTRYLLIFYVFLLFLLSMVVGGRSIIFVIILFLFLAVYVRYCQGLTAVPKSRGLKYLLVILVIAFLSYSMLIWKVRADCTGQSVDSFLAHAESVWGVKPSASLESVDVQGQSNFIRSIVSSIFYVTQSLSVVEKILGMDEPPVLLGAYHIDLVAAALRVFPEGSQFLTQGYSALLNSNVYGFFTSAWGALYIDFGFFGAYLAVLFWGLLAGYSYRLARLDIHSDRVTHYVFWMYSVLISFVSPPFGFSNSAVIFAWFFIYYLFRSPRLLNVKE